MSLYKKWQAMMDETGAIEKDTEVGYGHNKYRAVGEAAVLNMVKPLLKKYKIIVYPINIDAKEIVNTVLTSKGEATRAVTQLIVTWQIVDTESGESMTMVSIGNGADPQDKGSGKAMTYAYKVLFQKSLMLFSGEDTDLTHSNKITEDSEFDPLKRIGKEETAILNGLLEKLPEKRKIGFYDHFQISRVSEMNIGQYVQALKMLRKATSD